MPRHIMLVDLLREVHRGLSERMRKVVHEHGVPFTLMIVVRSIHEHPGITTSELARQLGMAKSHVSKTIETLSRRQLVEKRPDPDDQRLLRLHLTPSARSNWLKIRASIRKHLALVVANIPEETAVELINGLQVLKELLRCGPNGERPK